MNSHLNIFQPYTKTERSYQLENDLTRAFAITLQEDSLFFHEILKKIFDKTKFYNQLFESLENEINVTIDIQKYTSQIQGFEYIFAVSLSESEMTNFWEQNNLSAYDAICDLVIQINNILIVIEVKRDNVNPTSQLYNQIFNILRNQDEKVKFTKENYENNIFPIDLNWAKLMLIAVKVLNFEKSISIPNRFLSDFISLVRIHNFKWLPEPSISSLKSTNKDDIEKRISSAIEEVTKTTELKKLNYKNRLGFMFYRDWAQEIIFSITDEGNLNVCVYPGNTKRQGESLFKNEPKFNNSLKISGSSYKTTCSYVVKFSSWTKHFTGLWFNENDLKLNLFTKENFNKYAGRKKKEQWKEIEELFEKSFNPDFEWKTKCKWEELVINSGKTQFDISFGYEVYIEIPFQKLKEIDQEQSKLDNLRDLLIEINKKFNEDLLIECNK
ncbi:MAG TPA: hypothetical protein PLF32_05470 [Bacteroidales bacterium]|nr:hypothetical protein [Bacteroidales bacterium]HOR82084.1 hypothetical protein [Bacteroidales bacterium]